MKSTKILSAVLFACAFLLHSNLIAMNLTEIDRAFQAQPEKQTQSIYQRVRSWAIWSAWTAVEIGMAINDPDHYRYHFIRQRQSTTPAPQAAPITLPTRIDILDDFNYYLQTEELTDAREFGDGAKSRHKSHAKIITHQEFLEIKSKFIEQYPSEIKSIVSPKSPNRYIQKLLIPNDARVFFFGDLHGDIQAFVRMLCKLMQDGELDSSFKIQKPNTYIISLGDIVDYGFYSLDTLTTIMKLKIANPEHVFICRGNHEEMLQSSHFGFKEEVEYRYPELNFQETTAVFDFLPAALFIGIQGNPDAQFIQCCHGGIENRAENEINALLAENIFIKQLTGEQPGLNLQWGDFSGLDKEDLEFEWNEKRTNNQLLPMHKYFFSGIKKAISRIQVKYIFRGHQDQKYAYKKLVRTFDYPISLFPAEQDPTKNQLETFKQENSNFNNWLTNHVISLENLWDNGIILGSLPAEVAPVFTLSNASLVRQNYDEGFGLLTINNSWEESNFKFFNHRPEIFNQPTRKSYYTQINEHGTPTISTIPTHTGINPEFISKIRAMVK